MKLKIFDYDDNCYETEYDLEGIETIVCNVVSGDEVLIVIFKSGRVINLDAQDYSGNHRRESYFDTSMVIANKDLYQWNKRRCARVWYKTWEFTEDDDE